MIDRAQSHGSCPVSAARLPRAATPWRAAAFVFLAVALCAPVAADWLVTTEGERIETKGPWEIRGRLIVYTTPDGTLASLRSSRVDLEASDEATAQAANPPAAEKQARRPERAPVLVLTDKDVTRAAPAAVAVLEGGGEGESKGEGEAQQQDVAQSGTASSLEVVSYDDTFDAEENELVVNGRLRNNGRSLLTRIFLSVIAYDDDGSVIGRAEAIIDGDILRPGETTTFRAAFPALSSYGRLAFNVASSGFVTGQDQEEKGDQEEGQGETPPPPAGSP